MRQITVGHKDLRLGRIVYILVFYDISLISFSVSWLLPLDGFKLIFLLRDSENDLSLSFCGLCLSIFFLSLSLFFPLYM